jgi:hypothetical protein
MKIVEVTEKQFNEIWQRLLPAQRVMGQMTGRNIVLYPLDALIVIEGEAQVYSLVGKSVSSYSELAAAITSMGTTDSEPSNG